MKTAVCVSCNELLVQEDIPPAFTEPEIHQAMDTVQDPNYIKKVDIGPWVSKIGDQDAQHEYVREGFWSKVKKYASKVPFARDAVAMYFCAMDPDSPVTAKATAIGALAYWILPVDLIPDFIPVVGFADDATAILIAFNAIKPFINAEHHRKADEFFAKLINRSGGIA